MAEFFVAIVTKTIYYEFSNCLKKEGAMEDYLYKKYGRDTLVVGTCAPMKVKARPQT